MGKRNKKRKRERVPAAVPFAGVRRVLDRHLPNLDADVVEAMLAAIVANRLDGPPVWLEIIGPPSMGKTVIIEPLDGILGATLLSKLTPNTLLSGAYAAGGADPSLLTRLGRRPFLLIKELSTLLEGNPFGRGDIYAQLREVYDGSYAREYGNGVRRSWTGKATVIMGITPVIDRHRAFGSQLGERCLKIRFDCPAGVALEDLALTALENTGDEKAAKRELFEAYQQALNDALAKLPGVKLGRETLRKIANLAAFAATVRTQVERDQYVSGRPVVLPAAPEGPYRIAKKLGLVATALAALRGETDLSDLGLIGRIAFDCIPEPRRSILLRLMALLDRGVEPEASDLMGIVSKSVTYMALTDLELLGVIEVVEREEGDKSDPGRPPQSYQLSAKMQRWLRQSGLFPQRSKVEGIKEYKDTDTPIETGGKSVVDGGTANGDTDIGTGVEGGDLKGGGAPEVHQG